jgi:serine/threonine protein kinase
MNFHNGVVLQVDVYAFGIMLWEMLTGLVPWAGVTPMQVIYYVAVLQSRPPLPKTCPPPLKELIEGCWAEAPESRPGFVEILQRLRQAGQNAGPAPVVDVEDAARDKDAAGDSEDDFAAYALHSYASSKDSGDSRGLQR